jgi:hypothetical protein
MYTAETAPLNYETRSGTKCALGEGGIAREHEMPVATVMLIRPDFNLKDMTQTFGQG